MPAPEPANLTPMDLYGEIERLQSRIHSLSAELAATERDATLGVLARWLAHELANRLTPIAGYASIAMGHPDDQDLTKKALRHAKLGCERLSELAHLLLSLGDSDGDIRGEGSRLDEAWEVVSSLLHRDARERRVEIRGEVAAGKRVAMVASALEHVLLNITTNALKASQKGGVIELEVDSCSTGNTELVEIRVSDTGAGIPEGVLNRAFECGFSNSGGFGLGLALVKRLVEAVGGGIAIHSSLGSGTTAIVRIPALAD